MTTDDIITLAHKIAATTVGGAMLTVSERHRVARYLTTLEEELRVVTESHGVVVAAELAARAEVARLRAALTFYADEENWTPYVGANVTPMDGDGGKRARAALGEGT